MKQKLLKFKMRALMLAMLLAGGYSLAWADEEVVVDKTIATIAIDNSWENGICYTTFSLDDFVTITSEGGENCGFYNTDGDLQFDLNDKFTISVPTGCSLVTIDLHYNYLNYGKLFDDEDNLIDNRINSVGKYDANGKTSVTFNVKADATEEQLAGLTGTTSVLIKEIEVTYSRPEQPFASVKLNKYGYATYGSSTAVILNNDFNDSNCSAWALTAVEDTEITFTKVALTETRGLRPGRGVLLMGEPNGTYNLKKSNGSNVNVAKGSLLEGVTEETTVEDGKYFGLVGNAFVPVAGGTVVPAGKALLPASAVSGVKSVNLVFNDETGVREVRTISAEEAAEIFNLAGQRLQKAQKGVNIVNGKKVLVK